MKMTASTSFKPALLVLFGQIAAAALSIAHAAPETRTGTLRIRGTIASSHPRSAMPQALVVYTISDASASSASSTTQTRYITVPVGGDDMTATVNADIPYSATFDASHFSDVKMSVYFRVEQSKSDTGTSVTIAVPPNGATTPLSFALKL